MKIRKAIIPAAGFGTRFLPATKAIPKEMFPIVDTPTLQYIVEEVVKSGVTEIMIILGKNKKCIEDHFDIAVELESLLLRAGKFEYLQQIRDIANMAHIHYVRQKEMMGSANAILEAETFVGNEPFCVVFGDDIVYNPENPALKQLIEAYNETGKTIVGCQNVPKEEAIKYGVVAPLEVKGNLTKIDSIVEKPTLDKLPSTLASMGRFVFTPEIFQIIKNTPAHENGEVYITDAIDSIAKTDGAYALDFEGKRYDVGDKVGFIEATIEYGLRDRTIKDRLTTYIKHLAKKI